MTIRTLTLGALDTNCYLASDAAGHAVCIDPADDAPRILATASECGMRIEAIVLTHAHCDHFLAAEALRRETGAPLWISREDAAVLSDPRKNLLAYFFEKAACPAPADRTFDEGDRLSVGALCLIPYCTAGHTVGSYCIEVEGERTLFTGDTLFAFGGRGRTDFPTGDEEAIQKSLSRLQKEFKGYRAYAGHGPAFTI